jgi:hypothetical protein
MFIEYTDQVLGNNLGWTTFYLVPFYHTHQLSVFEKGNGR